MEEKLYCVCCGCRSGMAMPFVVFVGIRVVGDATDN
jgi:hypothetical protein